MQRQQQDATASSSSSSVQLQPHQEEGLRWLLAIERSMDPRRARSGVLADDMGLGKTFQIAALIRANPKCTLIVTTASTLHSWRDVVFRVAGVRTQLLTCGGICGDLLPSRPDQVALTTYSALAAHHSKPRPGCSALKCAARRGWGRLVLDEAHQIRNRKTVTFKAAMRLQAVHRWALSGTPINNGALDLAALSEWVRLPLNEPNVAAQYILRRTTHDVRSALDLASTMASVSESDSDLRERLQLPPGVDTVVVRLEFRHEHERELYAHLRERSVNEVGGEDTIVRGTKGGGRTPKAMELMLRMRQACVHPELYVAGLRKKRMRDGSGRSAAHHADTHGGISLEASRRYGSTKTEYVSRRVIRACAEDPEVKVVVFCEWLQEMELLADAIGGRHECLILSGESSPAERAMYVQHFSVAGQEPRVMLAQIKTGGVGLNLQAASVVIVTSPSWNPCNELQAISRSYRQGQSRRVICERVVVAGTVEEKCLDLQCSKLRALQEVFDYGGGRGGGGDEPESDAAKKDSFLGRLGMLPAEEKSGGVEAVADHAPDLGVSGLAQLV